MHICNVTRESELKLYIIVLLWCCFLVQDSHFCSMIRTVLKQASCPSEKILSHGHLFMNRAINISQNASCLSRCRLNG